MFHVIYPHYFVEHIQYQMLTINMDHLSVSIAAIDIRAEVPAEADDIILNSGMSELFVRIRLNEKDVTGA